MSQKLGTMSTKKVRQGPQMVRLVQFFFLRLTPIDKLEFTSYSQFHFPFRSYRNNVISKWYGAFPPAWIMVKILQNKK